MPLDLEIERIDYEEDEDYPWDPDLQWPLENLGVDDELSDDPFDND